MTVHETSITATDAEDGLARLGLNAESVFTDPRIIIWRTLPDRENGYLDLHEPSGSVMRVHVKRYPRHSGAMAGREAEGHRLLSEVGINTAPLLASGRLADGRGFVLFEDLAGHLPADKLLGKGQSFESILNPTADLAADLHNAGLHHRDLYLCHFMVKPADESSAVSLIDVARVGRMKNPLTRRRWIVKDLAQFWFSTIQAGISENQRARWLARYQMKRETNHLLLKASVRMKAAGIARHDVRLNRQQPGRNVSISG